MMEQQAHDYDGGSARASNSAIVVAYDSGRTAWKRRLRRLEC